MFGTTKIIEAIATVKADTANHNGELKEFKETFNRHIVKEESQVTKYEKKIDDLHRKISNFQCPHMEAITNVERRVHDNQKQNEKRRISDLETKNQETIDRADIDKGFAEDISSLQARSKYNLLSMAGLWAILGVILKKIFTT